MTCISRIFYSFSVTRVQNNHFNYISILFKIIFKGGLTPGQGKMTFPDFYPSENSDDGMLWSFLSRPGNYLFKYGNPFRSRYFQGFIDRSSNSTEWGPNDIQKGRGEYTCETGILPGHQPTAIQDLMDNFDIFFGGDFTKMTNYLRGSNNKDVRKLKKKLKLMKAYGRR